MKNLCEKNLLSRIPIKTDSITKASFHEIFIMEDGVPEEIYPTEASDIAPVFYIELNETETDGHVENNQRKDVGHD